MDKTVQEIVKENLGVDELEKKSDDVLGENLGQRVRKFRIDKGLTQNELSKLSGLSHSTFSKIENNQLSPTFETILKIVKGLNIDISELLNSLEDNENARTRLVITRKGKGIIQESNNYLYETLCTEIINKRMIPIVARIKSHSLKKFGKLLQHPGEELFYVLEGEVELITEHYAPVKLGPGDCAYFDSSMGHACLSTEEQDSIIFWVSTPT